MESTMHADVKENPLGEEKAPSVIMYATRVCPYCEMAMKLLERRGVTHIEKIAVDVDPAKHAEMTERTGRRTVPQIFIGGVHVGGYDDLAKLDREGKLVELLQATS